MSRYRYDARGRAKKPLSYWIAQVREEREGWAPEHRTEAAVLKEAKSRIRYAKGQVKRLDRIQRDWPKGKKKSQVILEHIAEHPEGLTAKEIRQWVWEKNGHKGKAYSSYYVGMLLRDETNDGKERLLPGWCVLDPVTKRWRIPRGTKIQPPFFRYEKGTIITAGEFRRRTGDEPFRHGVSLHRDPGCRCIMPDTKVIWATQLQPEMRKRLGLKND